MGQQQLQHEVAPRVVAVAVAVAGIFAFHVLHWQNRFQNAKNPLNYSKHKQAMIYGTETNGTHTACNRYMLPSSGTKATIQS